MVYIIIPARKNSIRLKGKNLLKLNNRSLIERTIDFARKIKFSKKIIVTTDINLEKFYDKKKIIFVKRSKKLSGKKTKIYTVIKNVIKEIKKNLSFNEDAIILLLQPTSPFRSVSMINQAYKKFLSLKKRYSVVSVSLKKDFKYVNKRVFIIKNNKLSVQSVKSSHRPSYIINGNFYFATSKFLKKKKSFFSDKNSVPYIISKKKFEIDIDTREDFQLAQGF